MGMVRAWPVSSMLKLLPGDSSATVVWRSNIATDSPQGQVAVPVEITDVKYDNGTVVAVARRLDLIVSR